MPSAGARAGTGTATAAGVPGSADGIVTGVTGSADGIAAGVTGSADGIAAGVAGSADGKVSVIVEPPLLPALLVGVAGPPCAAAAMPATMATNAPADTVPAAILDRRAGDCGGRGSVVGIMFGPFRLVVIVAGTVIVASRG